MWTRDVTRHAHCLCVGGQRQLSGVALLLLPFRAFQGSAQTFAFQEPGPRRAESSPQLPKALNFSVSLGFLGRHSLGINKSSYTGGVCQLSDFPSASHRFIRSFHMDLHLETPPKNALERAHRPQEALKDPAAHSPGMPVSCPPAALIPCLYKPTDTVCASDAEPDLPVLKEWSLVSPHHMDRENGCQKAHSPVRKQQKCAYLKQQFSV